MHQGLSLDPLVRHSNVTLNFSRIKIRMRCGLSLKLYDHLLLILDIFICLISKVPCSAYP